MIPDHYNPACGCDSCRAMMFNGKGGPLSMSEADLLALEARHDSFIKAGKHIRQHLTHCEYGDREALEGFDSILAYVGILDEVKREDEITQPRGEMAVHHEE